MGFAEMSVFVGILLVALIYLWRVGALDWGAQYQRHRTAVASRGKDQDVFAA
jgi:NADH-quinone oxidoreductase subunit A